MMLDEAEIYSITPEIFAMTKRFLTTLGICAAASLMLATPAVAQEDSPESAEHAVRAVADNKPAKLLNAAELLYHRGEWAKALKAYKKAYTQTPENSPFKAEAALGWSSLLWQQGSYKKASTHIDEALRLAEALKLDPAIGRLLLTKGQIEASRGRLSRAENTLAVCIKSATDQGDQAYAALCSINRRHVRQMRGRPAGPESDYRADVAKLKKAGTPLSVGSSLAKTAGIYEKSGNPTRALALLKEAQKQFDRAKSVPAKLRNRLRIAKLLQDQGRYAEARPYLAGKVAQFQSMNNRPSLVDALMLAAKDAIQRGHPGEAGRLYAKALNVAKQTGSPTLIARGHLALCEFGNPAQSADASSRELSKATMAHCTTAASQFSKLKIPSLAARSNTQLAKIHHATGRLNKANSYYSTAIQIMETIGVPGTADTPEVGPMRANLCQVNMTLETKGASFLCKKALSELERHGSADPAMLAATQYAVGITAGRDGRAANGIKNLKKAAQLAQKLSPPDFRLAADAHLRRGIIYAAIKDHQKDAEKAFQRGLSLTRASKNSQDPLATVRVQLRTQLAQLQLAQEDWKTAKTTLSGLVKDAAADAGSQAWGYNALARAALKQGDKPAAKKALQAGLPLAKKSGDTDLVKNFEQNLKKFD